MGTFVNKLLEEGKARLEDANKQALAAESNPIAQKRNVATREPITRNTGIVEDKPKDDFYSKLLADSARRKKDIVKRQQAALVKPTVSQKQEEDSKQLQAASSFFILRFKKSTEQKSTEHPSFICL